MDLDEDETATPANLFPDRGTLPPIGRFTGECPQHVSFRSKTMNTAPLRDSTATPNQDTVETLKTDLGKLSETVKALASEQFGSVADKVQVKAATTVTDLESAIRRNPTQAAVMAAGVGFLIGLVLTR